MSFDAKFARLHSQNGGTLFLQGLSVTLIQGTKDGKTDLTLLRFTDATTLKVTDAAADVVKAMNKQAAGYAGRFFELTDLNGAPLWVQGAALVQIEAGHAGKEDFTLLKLICGVRIKVKTEIPKLAKAFTEIAV